MFAPAEWRINGASAGLYTVERNTDCGWRLEGVFLGLDQAFRFAERLYGAAANGPLCAGLIALCGPANDWSPLPERYRVSTEESWRGRLYQAALERNPFKLVTDPDEAFRHPNWQHAKANARVALACGERVVLAGEPGTGKSLLLKTLARELDGHGSAAWLAGDDVLLVDGVPVAADGGPGIFTGPGEVTTVTLDPLWPEDVARFMVSRFLASGRYPDAVEPEAVFALAHHAGGRIRDVNALAGAAVFLADLESAPRLLRRHVDDAIALRDGTGEAANPPAALPQPAAGHGARRSYARLGAATAGAVLLVASSWTAYHVSRPASTLAVAELQTNRVPPPAPSAPVPADLASPPIDPPAASAAAPDEAPRLATVEPAAPPQPEPSEPDATRPQPAPFAAAGLFQGAVNNETMEQSGKLALAISRADSTGMIRARFHASDGLIGTGELAGKLTDNGHISASGQLMMGKNPFLCSLDGFIQGGRLVGSAQFVRPSGGRIYHSNFTLSKL